MIGVNALADDISRLPDTIFINGDIYTQAKPARVQALAVRDGRIVGMGSSDEVQKLKGRQTQVIDLGGRFVMPGFNDAHSHLAEAGMRHLQVDLTGSANLQEMQHRIGLKVNKAAPGEWILGSGWDHTLWPGQTLPTRQDVDVMTNGHPAIFVRIDGHIAIANTAAFEAAGVTGKTSAPQGGKIDLDAQGQPTGILRESAQGLVFSKVPAPTPAQRRAAAEASLADAARWGVTSAQDCSQWQDFLVYEDLEREGKLTLRISEWLRFNDSLDTLKQQRAHHSLDDPMLHTGMLKGYMDGSLGSRTAALLAPYSDDPGNSGLPQYQQPELNRMATERVAAEFQLGFHAIGDRAAQMALDAFAVAEGGPQAHAAPGAQAPKDFRLRIEHDQVIAPNQFALFKQLGVIASVQPSHLLTDMNWAESRIGSERAKTSYPWKQFADNGVMLAFGTDYPVEPINPFRGIYAAITRKNEAGTKEYFPEQKVTIEQALAAYTIGSAYAEFAEKQKGTLAPGMLADFVVLDRDLTKVSPAEILKTQVLRTVVGGKTVYEGAASANSASSPVPGAAIGQVILGIVTPTNSWRPTFSPDKERDQMVRYVNEVLRANGRQLQVSAVGLRGTSAQQITAEAKEHHCRYVLLTRVIKKSRKQESTVGSKGPTGPTSVTMPGGLPNSSNEAGDFFVQYQVFGSNHTQPVSNGVVPAGGGGLEIDSVFSEVVTQAVHDIQVRKSP